MTTPDAEWCLYRHVEQQPGRPWVAERWYENMIFGCDNGHISTMVLRSEELGRLACLAAGCRAPVFAIERIPEVTP